MKTWKYRQEGDYQMLIYDEVTRRVALIDESEERKFDQKSHSFLTGELVPLLDWVEVDTFTGMEAERHTTELILSILMRTLSFRGSPFQRKRTERNSSKPSAERTIGNAMSGKRTRRRSFANIC